MIWAIEEDISWSKYRTEVTINVPRERVLELFDSRENMYKWQEGLQSHEHLEGEPGQPGAKMKLVYDNNGRKIEMVETITTRNLTDVLSAVYESTNVWNLNESLFYEERDQTRWVNDTEFRCKGFMRFMTIFMPGMFKRQTLKSMNDFKAFAEGEGKL